MPGIIQAHEPSAASGAQKLVSSNDSSSVAVPYQRRPSSTAYGVNEPQWTIGPPPLIYGQSPYARIPLPPLSNRPIHIHPLLCLDPEMPIIWDINQPPSHARCPPFKATQHPIHWQALPAMDPPHVGTLVIRMEPLDRAIVIVAHNRIITIGEVFAAVYREARAGATRSFCNELGIKMDVLWSKIGTYEQIVVQDPGPARGSDEVSTTVASFMGFKTRWLGLTPSPKERDVWILHTRAAAGGWT